MTTIETDIDVELLLSILNADTVIMKGEGNATYGTRN